MGISDPIFLQLAERRGAPDTAQLEALFASQEEALGKGRKATLFDLASASGLVTGDEAAALEAEAAELRAAALEAEAAELRAAEAEAAAEEAAVSPPVAVAPPPAPAPLPKAPPPAPAPLPKAPPPAPAPPATSPENSPRPTSERESPARRKPRPQGRGTSGRMGAARKGRTSRMATSARQRSARQDEDERSARKSGGTPVALLAGAAALGLVFFVCAAAFVLSEDEEVETVDSGSPGGGTVASPDGGTSAGSEDPSPPRVDPGTGDPLPPAIGREQEVTRAERRMQKLADEAFDQARRGLFREAIETLERFPGDARETEAWRAIGAVDLERYQSRKSAQAKFEAALADAVAGDTEPLSAFIREARDAEFEFADEEFLEVYGARAAEALGEEAYDALVLKSDQEVARDEAEEAGEVEVDPSDPPSVPIPELAVELRTRGSAERRARFKAAAAAAAKTLEAARAGVKAEREARRRRFAALTKRVKKATRRGIRLEIRGRKKKGRVVEYDERGFTLKIGSKRRRYGWDTCPAELGQRIRKLATDTRDARQVYDLGLYAARRGLFDRAKRGFEQALRLDSSLKEKVPNLEVLKQFAKLLRGKHNRGSGRFDPSSDETRVLWSFDPTRPQEALDFEPLLEGLTDVRVQNGRLRVRSNGRTSLNLAQVRGQWERKLEVQVVPSSVASCPALLLNSEASHVLVTMGRSKVELYSSFLPEGEPLVEGSVGVAKGQRVTVQTVQKGETLQITVAVAGKPCLEHEMKFTGAIEVLLGSVEGGEAQFDELRCTGFLSRKWTRREEAQIPGALKRALDGFLRRQEARGQDAVPVAYRETSAEDDVALEGIPQEAQEAVAKARELMGEYAYGRAEAILSEVAERNIEYHAANYLRGLDQMADDPMGALIRLRRASKGVEQFYEAMTGEASALFWLGRYDEARRVLGRSLALRPDFAPSYVAQSNLLTLEGKYDEASSVLDLAGHLAPGDPEVRRARRRVRALAEGPAWARAKRAETDSYVLDTDMTAYAGRFAEHLEAIRTHYAEAFPVLLNPGAAPRKASVLVFSKPEGYYDYSERVSGDRSEDSLGHFSPLSGQLLLFLEESPDDWNTFHVLNHEGVHQWCNAQGVALPFWANEGIAEYLGGTRLSADGERIISSGVVDTFLKERLTNLTSNWAQREKTWLDLMNQSPEEFYEGDAPLKYAQAWSIVHFIMEGGDAKLKKTFMAYLEAYRGVDAGKKDGLRGGAALEYLYVETFHQLDMRKVELDWASWVQKLAKDAGIDWTLPR